MSSSARFPSKPRGAKCCPDKRQSSSIFLSPQTNIISLYKYIYIQIYAENKRGNKNRLTLWNNTAQAHQRGGASYIYIYLLTFFSPRLARSLPPASRSRKRKTAESGRGLVSTAWFPANKLCFNSPGLAADRDRRFRFPRPETRRGAARRAPKTWRALCGVNGKTRPTGFWGSN